MKLAVLLSCGLLAVASGACEKAPRRAPEPGSRLADPAPDTHADVAPRVRAAADDPSGMAEPPTAPSSRPSAPPSDDEDRDWPRRTGLPSSRVDGGGRPIPLPPGVTMDAGPL
jgi:hypothetical protein